MADVASPNRPRRAAAQNALYRPCPTCSRKFLITEIEFHVNLCLQKLERETGKMNPKAKEKTKTSSKQSRFKADKKYKKISPAPVFRPTEEEFKNPLNYINSIRHVAQQYGICKIIPPKPQNEWLGKPFNKTIQPEDFYFQTKKQNIRLLQRRGVADEFYCNLTDFLEKNQKELTAIPRITGKRIQLYLLYKSVIILGGFEFVNVQNLWGQVASDMKLAPIPAVLNQLKSIYENNLYQFELSPEKYIIPKRRIITSTSKAGMRAVKAGMGMQCVSAPEISKSNNTRCDTETESDEDILDFDDDDEEESFGFATGRVYSLKAFKKQANRFQRDWFRSSNGSPYHPTINQIETEYWNIIENREDNCRVHYGSDLDVSSHGSGFSVDTTSPWNLNLLPTLPQSLLRFLPEHVSGITIPMMYVGMVFSTFCWHVEDDYLYSINFLHDGAPKVWYGVSSFACTQFEQTMKEALPDLFEVQPDLLHHLTTMFSPIDLLEAGVPVVKAVQNPGEFMVTFPQAYHGGFNSGFNVAEAVNFATPDWLPFSTLCIKNYKLLKRTHIFSNVELVVNALQLERDPTALRWLLDLFYEARKEEENARKRVLRKGVGQDVWLLTGPLPHAKPCKICNAECYLSAIGCDCSPDAFGCLDHAEEFCSCPISHKKLLSRYSSEVMDTVATNAQIHASGKRYLPHQPIRV